MRSIPALGFPHAQLAGTVTRRRSMPNARCPPPAPDADAQPSLSFHLTRCTELLERMQVLWVPDRRWFVLFYRAHVTMTGYGPGATGGVYWRWLRCGGWVVAYWTPYGRGRHTNPSDGEFGGHGRRPPWVISRIAEPSRERDAAVVTAIHARVDPSLGSAS
jgi:hypothetical protein